MDTIFDDIKDALNSFENCVKKDLEEIRQQKSEMTRMKEELYNTAKNIKYLRDNGTLIVSAPNIILGNVDHSGNLIAEGGGSTVTIRANNISLEGVGTPLVGGNIVQRAASIRSIAVDPGSDGMENVVCDRSEIVCQANGITLQSDSDKGAFVSSPAALSGITISSDSSINVNATPSNSMKSKDIDTKTKSLDEAANSLKSEISKNRKNIDSLMKDLTKILDEQEDMNDNPIHLSCSHPDIEELHEQYEELELQLLAALNRHIYLVSQQAEINRRNDALKEIKKNLSSASSTFAKETTDAFISVQSEKIMFTAIDGDGNLRDNKEALFRVQSPNISFVAQDKDAALVKDSTFSVNSQNVSISTATAKFDEKREKGDVTAIGDVTITSKNVTVEAVDRELKDKKLEEKALTKDSKFNLRMESINAEATDTEGKSTGNITLNAKEIKATAMNVDKESRKDKELAQSSQMVLIADKMLVGSSDKQTKSQLVQVASDKVSVIATTTAEVQQGEAKAVVTLDGGNITLGASKNEINGDTTIAGKADIKGETTAPSGSFKSLEAGSSFKSPNISDGMGAPSSSTPGKPSAKLKEEEVKKESTK